MQPNSGLTLDSSGIYEICVQGCLDASWSQYVGGVNILIQIQPSQPPVTVITGEFTDQAALNGALSHLCNLGFPLLSVRFTGIGQP